MKKLIFWFLSYLLMVFCIKGSAQDTNSFFCFPNSDPTSVYEKYQKGKPLANIDFTQSLNPTWTQHDLSIMRQVLLEANTGLYRYATKEKIDSVFNKTMCDFKEPVSYLQFVRAISKLFKTIACGHSGWSHNPDYRKYRNNQMKFFPLRIFFFDKKYYIRQNNSTNPQLHVGDQILQINGQSPTEINNALRQHMVRDGESGSKGTSGINTYFHMAYSNFIANPDTFELVVQSKQSSKRQTIHLQALKLSTIDSIKKSKYESPKGMGKPLRFKISSNKKNAYYTIKWFRNEYIKSQGQHFTSFTDSVFQVLHDQKIDNLVIDLRGNRGGWTANGMELFSYFINKPTEYIKKIEFNKTGLFSFNPIVLKDQGIHDSMLFAKNKRGLFEWSNYHALTAKPKLRNSFKGQVYILIDDMSFSCSAVFSALMRSHTNAIFIGEENGGAQCGQNGMVIAVQLPFTGLILRISTAKYICNVTDLNNSKGVIPDYEIKTTWNDFIRKRDPQMEFVNQLVK